MKKSVVEYAFQYYSTESRTSGNVCCLCGNQGVIDTRGKAITPRGEEVGKLAYCICPNGQTLRKANAPLE